MRLRFAHIAVLSAITVAASGGGAGAQSLVERGRYLVAIGICESCHTPRDKEGLPVPGMSLAGGTPSRTGGTSSNITPDPDTGIGRWSDQQIIDAMRNGKRPDGSMVGPPMPIPFYKSMSDSDARAIVAYLRTVPPVRNPVARKALDPKYGPDVGTVADVATSDKLAYGEYLATVVAHCMPCHSPRVGGRIEPARAGAGGNRYGVPGTGGTVVSPNLTPANADGIASWTDAQIKTAITTGVRPNGSRIAGAMETSGYRSMTAGDLDAIVAFLRTLKPAATPAGEK